MTGANPEPRSPAKLLRLVTERLRRYATAADGQERVLRLMQLGDIAQAALLPLLEAVVAGKAVHEAIMFCKKCGDDGFCRSHAKQFRNSVNLRQAALDAVDAALPRGPQ